MSIKCSLYEIKFQIMTVRKMQTALFLKRFFFQLCKNFIQ